MTNRDDRFYTKRSTEDQRTPSQRDRDRILHASALRRLGNVTQVVNPTEGRFYHNRLTHTLKVAQIARRIAEKLIAETNKDLIDKLGGLNPDVVEAAALAHDLGHPPFGHIGEKQLNKCVSKYNPNDGYEGNAQSFRIVTKLEIWREGVLGLDLTAATLNAILKYPRVRPNRSVEGKEPEIRYKKWGAYRTEKDVLEWVRDMFKDSKNVERYHTMSLEAAIMDWADDIAYATHDVEDFYKAGLIPLDRLNLEVSAKYPHQGVGDLAGKSERSIDEQTAERNNDNQTLLVETERFLPDVIAHREKNHDPQQIKEVFERIFRLLPLEPYRGSRKQQGVLRGIISNLIGSYVKSTKINKLAESSLTEPRLAIPQNILLEVKILKDLTRFYVINNRSLVTQQYGEARVVEDLFNFYFDASNENSKHPMLPLDFENLLETELSQNEDLPETALRARIIADVISSMSDDEALNMHQRLSGFKLGSFLDRLP